MIYRSLHPIFEQLPHCLDLWSYDERTVRLRRVPLVVVLVVLLGDVERSGVDDLRDDGGIERSIPLEVDRTGPDPFRGPPTL